MSGIHWWKKEVSLRRPRGTVVVAKPVVPADLVERAAALFDELESDLSRSTLHEHVSPPALFPAKPAEPVEPAGNAPPALPAVWPQALVESAPHFSAPAPVEVTPAPQPEPEVFAKPQVPEAAYFLEPFPAPLPLDETPETFWPPVSPFPVEDHTEIATPGAAAFDNTDLFEDTAAFAEDPPYDADPFESPDPYELHSLPVASAVDPPSMSFDAVSFDSVSFDAVSFDPAPEPELGPQTPPLEWLPFVSDEPTAAVEPELARRVELELEPEAEPMPAAEATPAPPEFEAEPELELEEPPALKPVATTPLLKRELHLPRRRAGKEKGPKHEAARPGKEKAHRPKVRRPKQSIWERNLSLPSLRRADAPVKLVGLRVGSTQLSAAHVANSGSINSGTIELLQLARSPLRPGVVVGGEVREPDTLATELKTFFAQNKLPRRGIRLGVASNRIGVRVLEMPVIEDPKAFGNAIRFRAQELLPIPVTDAVLDHVVLGEYVSDNGDPMCRVLLAFAHRDLVDRHAEACQKAGLKLAGVDLDAFALLRSLSEPRGADTEPTQAVVAVAIGHERTVFAVSDGLICDFVRVLEWGGSALDGAIAHSLDLSPELAHAVKHQLDLVDGTSAAPDGLSTMQVEAARAAVRDELSVLSQEIVSSLRFYQTRPGSLAIGELLLTGGGAELPGLAEELERLVGVPVRAADPLGRVHLGKKVKRPAEAGSFAVAIGLGIEG